MSLKVNLGVSKKVGLPDYGSLGASCHVEVELDGSLLFGDLDGFHQKVRHAYVACTQAVNDELARHGGASERITTESKPTSNGNGQANGQHGTNGNRASDKQLSYVRQLAGQVRGLGVRRMETLTGKMFGKPLADMTSFEASSLIDTLKAVKEGRLDVDTILNGATT